MSRNAGSTISLCFVSFITLTTICTSNIDLACFSISTSTRLLAAQSHSLSLVFFHAASLPGTYSCNDWNNVKNVMSLPGFYPPHYPACPFVGVFPHCPPPPKMSFIIRWFKKIFLAEVTFLRRFFLLLNYALKMHLLLLPPFYTHIPFLVLFYLSFSFSLPPYLHTP